MFENIEEQLKLWDELTKDVPVEEVPIEGVVNLKSSPISDFKVRLAYGDLTLIIAMIRDYIRMLDEEFENGTLRVNEYQYQCYYRAKYLAVAERISQQIDYDYDKQVEICKKKMIKGGSNSDVGEESLSLTFKRTSYQKPTGKAEEKADDMSINEKSTNPFDHIETEQDIPFLVDFIIRETDSERTADPFWSKTEICLLTAVIALQYEFFPKEDQTLAKTGELLKEDLDALFEKRDPGSMAVRNYRTFAMASGTTRQGIITTVLTRLSKFDKAKVRSWTPTRQS